MPSVRDIGKIDALGARFLTKCPALCGPSWQLLCYRTVVWGEFRPASLPGTRCAPVEIGRQVFHVGLPSGAVCCHFFQGKCALLDVEMVWICSEQTTVCLKHSLFITIPLYF